MSKSLKIALAEPSLIIRSGLISVLKRLPGYDIHILEIPEITFINGLLKKFEADLLIFNPLFPGLPSLNQIKNDCPNRLIRYVAIQYIMATPAMQFDETITIYDTAEQIEEKINRLFHIEDPDDDSSKSLSNREKEIIVCIVKGMSNKQIADCLCLSTHTVMTHRRNITNKLQIHSTAGLTIYAIVNKLGELNDIKDSINEN